VLSTLSVDRLTPVIGRLTRSDLPALWKPKPNHFFRIDALPMLGTGKMDLRGIKTLASSLAPQQEA